jgi:hypothetical protein
MITETRPKHPVNKDSAPRFLVHTSYDNRIDLAANCESTDQSQRRECLTTIEVVQKDCSQTFEKATVHNEILLGHDGTTRGLGRGLVCETALRPIDKRRNELS